MTKEQRIAPIIHRWSEWRGKWKPCAFEWKGPNGATMRWSKAEGIIRKRQADMIKRIIKIATESRPTTTGEKETNHGKV